MPRCSIDEFKMNTNCELNANRTEQITTMANDYNDAKTNETHSFHHTICCMLNQLS